jgi:hypothetical protein
LLIQIQTWLEILMVQSPLWAIWLPIQGSSDMAKQVAKVCGIEHNWSIAVTEASKDLLCLKRLACELGFKQDNYVLFCDN